MIKITAPERENPDPKQRLYACMQDLRLTFLMSSFKHRCEEDPSLESSLPWEFLDDVFAEECTRRKTNNLNRKLSASELKYPAACLDETIEDPRRMLNPEQIEILASCGWIRDRKNLIITGLTGAGKTYLGCSLAVCALMQNLSVLYKKANRLMNELKAFETLGTLDDFVKSTADKVDLLIIDDFGLMKLDLDMCRNLFELIDAREDKQSTLIVSQLQVSDWYGMFQNATFADAILDRLTKDAFRVDMKGMSMRQKSN